MNKHILVALLAISSLAGCAPDPDSLRLTDEMVVSTYFDTGAEFSEYLTYATSTDTIGYVSNTNPNDTILVYRTSFQYPRKVIDAVRKGMNDLGYNRVAVDANPDVGMNIYVVENLNLFQQVVYPPGYYGGYYGYYGYYYYPYVQTYAYNTATLVVEMVDLKNRSGNQVKVIWTAYMGDVVSSADYELKSAEAIEQAFIQSPYLNSSGL